jgi:MazG family protein
MEIKQKRKSRQEKIDEFGKLLDVMDELREKCPWDKKQTFKSLRTLTIEEVHELSESILEEDYEEVKRELGDLLLHIVFYSRLGEEQKGFDILDVSRGIKEKLIRRHPHVFGDVKAETEEEVKRNWEEIKIQERNTGVMSGVPSSLPALVKALRIQEKAAGVGFDWGELAPVWEKLDEEILELKDELGGESPTPEAEEEFGDLVFTVVNLSRFLKINPEDALEKANRKFISRFKAMEEFSSKQKKKMSEYDLDELEEMWEMAKSGKI